MATALLDLVGVLLIGAVGFLAAASVQGAALPARAEDILDRIGMGSLSAAEAGARLAVIGGVVLISKSLVYAWTLRRIFGFLASRQQQIASRMVRQVLAQSIRITATHSSQELLYAVVTRVPPAVTNLLSAVSIVASEVTVLVLLGLALLLIDPVVTVITVVFFVLLAILIQRFLGRWSSRTGRRRAEGEVDSYEGFQEVLVAHREVQVLSRQGQYARRIDRSIGELARGTADDLFITQLPKLLYEGALVAGVLALAAWQLATQDLVTAVATLALFLAAGFRLLPTMIRLNSQMIAIRGIGALVYPTIALARELELGHSELDLQSGGATWIRDNADFTPTVVIDDVTFTYPGQDAPAVRAVTLSVPAGGSLALVGRSGAGKSTLADIILGIVEPQEGSVRIGGCSPRDAISRWPGSIAYVPQMVATFNSTVRENVLMGLSRDEVTEAEIWEALDAASLAAFFRASGSGLDSLVGERGVKLSGGQRQRLGLARALLTHPKLLVLDEATSALDAETENDVTRAVGALSGSVTTVTIAHRLTTIQHADVVAYLEDGQCVAVGTFEEIRSQNSAFERQAQLLGIRP